MNKTIITDIDGTVLDLAAKFEPWMEARGFAKAVLHDQYGWEHHYGITEKMLDGLLREFMATEDFCRLPPIAHAELVFPALLRHDYTFVAVTAVPDNYVTKLLRRRNLFEALGQPFDFIHHVGFRGDKSDVLHEYPRSVWVEDHRENALAGVRARHHTFLLDRPYNQGPAEDVTRVKDWIEIAVALGIAL